MTDWMEVTRRAALASHRLVGWIYWDPGALEHYQRLGPQPFSYYIATRASSLADAGNQAVEAAFYSIHPELIAACLDECRAHTTFARAAAARDQGVIDGLHLHVPQIEAGLAELADPLWAAADSLPASGRVLFATLRERPRPADQVLSAWLAVNCLREWRGDTHWALHTAEALGHVASGILDGAWRAYADDWVPRSRGADDAALAAGFAELEGRGLAEHGVVTDAGLDYRQGLEDRLDRLCCPAWQGLGEEASLRFLDLIEPVGDVLIGRIDQTAGPEWMPAARDRPRR